MNRKFSDRIGVTKPNPIQLESMNLYLKNSIWNLILRTVFSGDAEYSIGRVRFIAVNFLRFPLDEVPLSFYRAQEYLKSVVYHDSVEWWYIYNLLEFLQNHAKETLGGYTPEEFTLEANKIFEEESSGYRFVNGYLIPITNTSEISSITNAIEASHAGNLYGAEKHLNAALDLLSKKPSPDYRNSIKESISAIESLVKQLTGEESGGLDKALNKLDAKVNFHGAFKSGLSSLYGYTSDEDGIRHAILEEIDLGFDEAKFMLVTCSALVNLIIAKANKHGLLSTPKL
jgi:hypothetical protein